MVYMQKTAGVACRKLMEMEWRPCNFGATRNCFKVSKNVNFETNSISNETWEFHLLTKMITLKRFRFG